jgi:hypothetical protein
MEASGQLRVIASSERIIGGGSYTHAALINMVARLSQAVRHRCAAALVVVVRSGCYVDMAGVDMLYASYMRVYRMMSWKLKRA